MAIIALDPSLLFAAEQTNGTTTRTPRLFTVPNDEHESQTQGQSILRTCESERELCYPTAC